MKAKLSTLWESIKTSFWFIPGLMLLAAVGLSSLANHLDKNVLTDDQEPAALLYIGGLDGARAILSTIAGSMITVAGVVFSITMVALTLTTRQFGPRLLRNFFKDKSNQVAVGTFIATFAYCLLVSRTVQSEGNETFLPRLGVSLAILLAIISVAVLVYFIHHASTSIRAEEVVAATSRELRAAINRLFPDGVHARPAPGAKSEPELELTKEPSHRVSAESDGYLISADETELIKLAVHYDIVIQTFYRPGDYVFSRTSLAEISPARLPQVDLDRAVRDCFLVRTRRIPRQDIEFGISELVEVAVRALSPGVYDPITAINCIDHLTQEISILCTRRFPRPQRYDGNGRLRLILDVVTFDGIMDSAFHQIRQYSSRNVDVQIRLLEALGVLANSAHKDVQLSAIRRHAEMVHRSALEAASDPNDRADVDERYRIIVKQLSRQI